MRTATTPGRHAQTVAVAADDADLHARTNAPGVPPSGARSGQERSRSSIAIQAGCLTKPIASLIASIGRFL